MRFRIDNVCVGSNPTRCIFFFPSIRVYEKKTLFLFFFLGADLKVVLVLVAL